MAQRGLAENIPVVGHLQVEAISSLKPQLDLVKNKIALSKAQHTQSHLQRGEEAAAVVEPRQKKEALGNDHISLNSRKLPEYKRMPLEERLKALDGVGHSLTK